MKTGIPILMYALLAVPGAGASAAAVDVGPAGFESRNEAAVAAAPDRVYGALLDGVGKWWDPEHTYSGNSANLGIDPKPGGCFCEQIPGKGWIEHMRVIYVSKPDTLRLSGGLGPLQEAGLAGTLTWSLKAEGEGTRITQSYRVGGNYPGGFAEIAPLVDSVLAVQFNRLRTYVETGNPVPAGVANK